MTNEIVLIAEAEKQYLNEWLIFEVTETDEVGNPIRGRLLAHSPDRSAIDEVLLRLRPKHFYVFWAGEVKGVFVLWGQ